ncbi:MAG: hypothetical protein ACR2RA_18585 [Geminicoccaceae bacterium]
MQAGSAAAVSETSALAERLLDALPSRAHAADVGKAHLAALAKRPDARTLVAEITSCMGMTGADLRQCTVTNLQSTLRARTASGFIAGRTVRVGGWVLSANEVRLFSLAAVA